jgi:hypothetical protein
MGEFDGPDGAGGSIPPVKTPEQIQEDITVAMQGDGSIEPKIIELNTIVPKVPPVTTVIPQIPSIEPNIDFKPNPIWDKIKSSYEKDAGEGTFVIPDGINSDNEHDKLIEFLQNNLEIDTTKLHPFVKEVLDASEQENFDPNDFIKSKVSTKSYMDLPSNEFMKAHLKMISERDKKGWTDEDIQKHIDSKDKIQLDAEVTTLKQEYKKHEILTSENRNKEIIAKREEKFNKIQDKRNQDITTLIERNKMVNDFYGIKLSEAEKKDFHTWLPNMLTVNKETGSYPLMDYMRSDDNLMKIAAIVYKTEKGMRDYLTDLKEGVKSDLMTKLRLTPNSDGGSIVTQGQTGIDTKKLED